MSGLAHGAGVLIHCSDECLMLCPDCFNCALSNTEMDALLARGKIRYIPARASEKGMVRHLLGVGWHDNIALDEQESRGRNNICYLAGYDSDERIPEDMVQIPM